jgi:glycosidase
LASAALGVLWASCLAAPSLATAATPVRDYAQEPARSSPAWLRDGVVYQIFPRNFSACGDFNGVTAQLDRLQKLGVNVLWLMPINPIGQLKRKGTMGSPYAVQDYYAINPDYGSKQDLQRLVRGAHQRGMKVIVDVVINHTAWDSVLIQTPAFYTHNAKGQIIPPDPDWSDVADLNYDNPTLRRYLIDMLSWWVRDFDLDGFRCDVALFIPTAFWEEARAALDKVKPDIIMLAEAEQPDLLTKAFDFDYSWKLETALEAAITGRGTAAGIATAWSESERTNPRGALHMRFSDNHDMRRTIARYGERGALVASALLFTLDGVPLIYNGMEVGDTAESGWPALFEKLPIFWQTGERRAEFPPFYAQLVAFRKAHPVLRGGSVEWLHNSDENRVLTFVRRSADEMLLIAVNLSSQPFVGVVEAADGSYRDITPTTGTTNGATGTSMQRSSALPALSLGAYDYRVYRRN